MILVLLIVFIWTLASLLSGGFFPSIKNTLRFAVTIPACEYFKSTGKTLTNSLLGFFLAFVLAIISVLLSYLNRTAKDFFNAVNTFVQSVSVLVWSILSIIIFGVTSSIPPILVTTFAVYPILLTSTLGAVSVLDRKLIEVSKMLGASKLQEFTYVLLPGSIPYVVSASRAAIGIALRISVVAEAFGASGGIGYQIVYNYDLARIPGVLTWSILLILLMIVIDFFVLKPVEKWTLKWKM